MTGVATARGYAPRRGAWVPPHNLPSVAHLQVLSRREASIFACITDTVVAPEPVLPPVRETDAVAFFDDWMQRLPRVNRAAMRALLWAAELTPRFTGFGARLRRLDRTRRHEWLRGVERGPIAQTRMIVKLLVSAAQLAYYGDDAVMLRLGYDADANKRRGDELRAAEGRP